MATNQQPAARSILLGVCLLVMLPGCGEERVEPVVRERVVKDAGPEATGPVVLFLGDSLTFGYGLSPDESYPSVIERKIEEAGLAYQVVNAGVSGDTTAGGLRRLDWLLRREPSVMVLALGANDGLRGIPVETTRSNLKAIVEAARKRFPDVRILLAGMQAPPNMGQQFTDAFRQIFPELAEELDLSLIPFLLEGVAGDPELNLPDGIHPNPDGQKIVAENVWKVLELLVRSEQR
ncbi:MAG: arylesterase [Planctomycetota bacterium]